MLFLRLIGTRPRAVYVGSSGAIPNVWAFGRVLDRNVMTSYIGPILPPLVEVLALPLPRALGVMLAKFEP
uniref:Uncharacterized protein n=1 Tax=Pristionchus pacificus TaxID=54126 RepID=A0A2A6BF94_PRIPA|eukprot:PDM64585.1 hypothetical protein PRIPAC_52841 [Pristionchus pacificus]